MPRAASAADPGGLTRRLAERAGDWVLPFWLERQTDPASPDFAATGDVVVNVTHREVVPVGTLGSPRVATVDPRGLVTPWPGGWSLDWWVGADDRWHMPSREVAVRQSLVDDAPVVETAMRVPGGDVVQRVWAFHDAGAGDVLAVEVENASRVPVALALAVRPYGPAGAAPVGSIRLDGRRVHVDGRPAIWLPKPPSRAAASDLAGGDVATVVCRGDAVESSSVAATCPDGLTQLALVVPLAHTASFRVLVPLSDDAAVEPTAVPPAAAVARGWRTHAARGTRVELPDAELAAAFAAARARVLLAAADRSLAEGDAVETAAIVGALDRCALHDEADAIVATLPDGQGPGARLGGRDTDPRANGAVLFTAGRHWTLGRDAGLVAELAGPLAAAAHRRPGGRLARRSEPELGVGGAMWHLAGAGVVADALEAAAQHDAADEVRRQLGDVAAAVDAAMRAGALDAHDPAELLDALVPLAVRPADTPDAGALLDTVVATAVHGLAVRRRGAPAGLSPEGTARLAQAELRAGRPEAVERARWLVEQAASTVVWPALVHPRTGGGTWGAGWSVHADAALVELVTDLFAVEAGPSTLLLCPVLPPSWLGAGFEVHGLPTAVGVLSYAVRWHGERPALLWEVAPHVPEAAVELRSPGLDPSWSTTALRGDALLDVPPAAAEATAVDAAVATDEEERSKGSEAATHAPGDAPASGPAEGQSFG